MSRKIYFAGSIRAGRDDSDLYARLIEQLKKYGTVLTEHVGSTTIEKGQSKVFIFDYVTRKKSSIRQIDVFDCLTRPQKNICVFTVTCQKNLGSVGRD
jgi:hypothetical protein